MHISSRPSRSLACTCLCCPLSTNFAATHPNRTQLNTGLCCRPPSSSASQVTAVACKHWCAKYCCVRGVVPVPVLLCQRSGARETQSGSASYPGLAGRDSIVVLDVGLDDAGQAGEVSAAPIRDLWRCVRACRKGVE